MRARGPDDRHAIARLPRVHYPDYPMVSVMSRQRDPIAWCALAAVAFLALVWHRLGIPSRIYFDEVHYVPAARAMLELKAVNTEHPLFAKELLAAAIALLGDTPLHWRVPSALLGAFGLFAFGRMLWWASLSRFASLSGMLLLATGFAWFIQSRIAMLDMVMASLAITALWMVAASVRLREQARWRLALAGVCLGLSLGAKWSVASVAVLPGLAFLFYRLRDHGRSFLTASSSRPIAGISLLEAALWLGQLPLAVYWLTFLPAFFYVDRPIGPLDFIEQHRSMIALHDSVMKPHPYRSVWYQWVGNWRAIWYLYEQADGAQRGVLLIGNPFTMLAGLPALLWCLWAGLRRGRGDALAFAALYVVSLGMWAVSGKPIQFYYHYLLPGTFLIACLTLALDALWQSGGRLSWLAAGALVVAAALFVWFYPIISSAPLMEGPQAFNTWMWLDSWR